MTRATFMLLLMCLVLPPGAAAAAPVVPGHQKFLDSESIEVKKLTGRLPHNINDPVWKNVRPVSVPVYVQHSVRLNDLKANAHAEVRSPKEVMVRAAMNDGEIAVLLEWFDLSEDRSPPDATDVFGDAAALQLPQRFGKGIRLPYIGMGDIDQPVYVAMQRAMTERRKSGVSEVNRLSEYVAAGFGSLTRTPLGWMKMGMDWDPGRRAWRALFIRSLATNVGSTGSDLRKGLVPISFAIWDGARHQRGGNKLLAPWRFLRLPAFPVDPAYVAELAFGYGPSDLGDAQRGKPLVDNICSACHRLPGRQNAPDGLAPDLTNIGGIASVAYLRDSIVDPSSVVVPGLGHGRHYNKAAAPDAFKAYPNNEAFIWFSADPKTGKRTSKMPSFGGLPQEQLADMLAYLKTLGADPAPTPSTAAK